MPWPHRRPRRATAAVVVVPFALLLTVVAGCHSATSVERLPRPQDPPKTDPAARAELVELATRGARATWWVASTFVRSTGGTALRSTLTEVNRPPDHVVVGVGGVTGVLRGRSLSCSPATGGPLCAPDASSESTAEPDALARLTDAAGGSYSVRHAASRRVAGIAARCFRLDRNNRATTLPYGTNAVVCYSDEGVPVTLDVDRPSSTDRIAADSVQRLVTDAALDALVAPYAGAPPVGPLPPGTGVVPAVPPATS